MNNLFAFFINSVWLPPRTTAWGNFVSLIALLSCRNSGFDINPKSLPFFLFDFFSKIGKITFFIVPGITVLLIRIIGFFLFFKRFSPIVETAFLIIDRSIEPFLFCGVPTVTKIKSQSLINEKSFLIFNFFFSPFCKIFSHSG